MLLRFFVTLSLCFTFLFAGAQKLPEVRSTQEWNELTSLAQQSGKPIFLLVKASWCSFCKQMEKEVLRDPEVAEYLTKNFMALRIDGETYAGMQFIAEYGLDGYPSLLWFDPQAKAYLVTTGVQNKSEFLASGQLALNRMRRYPELKKAYADRRLTRQGWLEMLDVLRLQEGEAAMQPFAEEFVMQLPVTAYTNDSLSPWFQAYALDVYGGFVRMLLADADYLRKNLPSMDWERFAEDLAAYNLPAAITEADSNRVETTVEALNLLEPDSTGERGRLAWMTFHAELGQWNTYRQVAESGWPNDESRENVIYRSAYSLIQEYGEVPAARNLALTWLAPLAEKDHFAPVYLQAYVQMMSGETREAYQGALRAKSLASDSAQQRAVDRLLEDLANR